MEKGPIPLILNAYVEVDTMAITKDALIAVGVLCIGTYGCTVPVSSFLWGKQALDQTTATTSVTTLELPPR